MSKLWVPPKVAQENRASTEAHNREVMATVHRFKSIMDDFNRDLKKIDRDLELIFAPPGAKAAGLVPGRYHIMKHVPGGPPSLIPITGPNGEFVEPNSSIFEMLHKLDLQNPIATRERRRQQEEAERAKARRKAREDEERLEEIRDRYNAAFRTSISMNRDSAWSQNVKGRRGPR